MKTNRLHVLLAALLLLFLGFVGLVSRSAERNDGPPGLLKAHRIVFLGDSITYSGQCIELIEAYCVTRFPEQRTEFINLGLPSETVSGLSEDGHAGGKFPRPDL